MTDEQQFHFVTSDPNRPLTRTDKWNLSSHVRKTTYRRKRQKLAQHFRLPSRGGRSLSLSRVHTNQDYPEEQKPTEDEIEERRSNGNGGGFLSWKVTDTASSPPQSPASLVGKRFDTKPMIMGNPRSFLDSLLDPFNVVAVALDEEMSDHLRYSFIVLFLDLKDNPKHQNLGPKPWEILCPTICSWAINPIMMEQAPPYVTQLVADKLTCEPAVIYALCSLSAAHRPFLKGQLGQKDADSQQSPDLTSLFHYQGKTMEYLRQLMEKRGTAPASILVTIILLAIAVMRGSKAEGRLHLKGLRALLDTPTGWGDIPIEVAHAWMVNIYLYSAWIGEAPPSPPSLPHKMAADSSLTIPLQLHLSSEMATSLLRCRHALDSEMCSIVRETQEMIILREVFNAQKETLPPDNLEHFLSLRYRLERRIMLRLFSKELELQMPSIPCKRAVLTSLLILSITSMMILKKASPPLRQLCKILKDSLPPTDLDLDLAYDLLIPFSAMSTEDTSTPIGSDAPSSSHSYMDPSNSLHLTEHLSEHPALPPRIAVLEVHLWMLFLGAHISMDDKDETGESTWAWYIARIRRMMGALDLEDWEDVKAVLERSFYVERIYGLSFRRIWKEV